MKLSDKLSAYMQANTPEHPFKVHAAMIAMAQALRDELPSGGRDALKSARKIEGTALALTGVLSLHLDNEWSSALRAKRWWEKRKFAATRDAWKAELRRRLSREAAADIASLRHGGPGRVVTTTFHDDGTMTTKVTLTRAATLYAPYLGS